MTPTTLTRPPALDDPTTRHSHRRLPRMAAVAGAVLAALALPTLVDAYIVSIASAAIVLATLALSVFLLAGLAGLPSLGQAAYLGVGAYSAALLADTGVSNGPVQLAVATLAGALAAALCSPLALRTRGTAFLMVSFAIAELTRTTASSWASLTAGDEGIHTPPVTLWPHTPPLVADGYIYLYLLGCFLLLTTATVLLLRSRLALVLRAAADHEPRLESLGHHVPRALLAGFVAAGALAGAAGAFLVTTHGYVSPGDLGLDTSALALLAAAIGGRSLPGTIAGALAIVAVRDLLGTPTGGHAMALLGLAFLLVAYRRPASDRLRRTVLRARGRR
jgi:ABC-type branched-subunit amino acid transport system permease subunit